MDSQRLEDISVEKQNKSVRKAAGISKTFQDDLVEVHKKWKYVLDK